jgi:putative flippase GtrA
MLAPHQARIGKRQWLVGVTASSTKRNLYMPAATAPALKLPGSFGWEPLWGPALGLVRLNLVAGVLQLTARISHVICPLDCRNMWPQRHHVRLTTPGGRSSDIPMKRFQAHSHLLQLTRFAISSGMSATLSLALPILLHEVGKVDENAAVAVGFVSAYVMNFFMLRVFVFKSKGGIFSQIVKYVPVNGFFRLAEFSFFLILNNLLSLNYILAVASVLFVSTVLKFFGYRRLFRDKVLT